MRKLEIVLYIFLAALVVMTIRKGRVAGEPETSPAQASAVAKALMTSDALASQSKRAALKSFPNVAGLAFALWNEKGKSYNGFILGSGGGALLDAARRAIQSAPPDWTLANCRLQIGFAYDLKDTDKDFSDLEPGLRGLVALRDGKAAAWWLPEETLLNSLYDGDLNLQGLKTILSQRLRMNAKKSEDEGKTRWMSFAAVTFIQSAVGSETMLPMFRGTPLLEATPDAEGILEACRQAGGYFIRTINDEGRFYYRFNPATGEVNQNGYNNLRHCGCVFSMLELYGVTRDEELLAAARRALDYILQYVPEKLEGEDFRFVTDPPDASGKRQVKTGGAGLLLLALTEFERTTEDNLYRPLADDLVKFILSMQLQTGDYYAYFDIEKRAPVPGGFSMYYSGEAALGLIRYYKLTGNEAALDSAGRALLYLTTDAHKNEQGYVEQVESAGYPDLLLDSWRTMGMREYFELRGDIALADECIALAEGMITHQYQRGEDVPEDFIGSPRFRKPNTISSGSRKEGLTSAWWVAHARGQSGDKILAAISDSSLFALRRQFRPETMYYSATGKELGGFANSLYEPEVRNDGVQHNLSGLLGYYEILKYLEEN